MYSSSVYSYIPRQTVVMMSGTSVRRYQTVFAKNLKLHKGVDNKIQFQLINQDQKPINVTGKQISFRLISDDGSSILLSKMLTPMLELTGIMELQLNESDLIDVGPQLCGYSLEITDGQTSLPIFVNSDSGARGTVQVLNSILPNFIPSLAVSVPNHQLPVGNVPVTYYSSVFSSQSNGRLTAQVQYINYTGTVQIQGSTLPDSEWYAINDPYTYTSSSDAAGYNIDGYHPYLRIQFVSSVGEVPHIYLR